MQPLFLTSQRLITEHWPTAAALLQPVLGVTRGEWEIDDLEELCRDGRAIAGIGFQDGEPVMAWVFEFRFYPRKTTVNLLALAGRGLQDVAATFWPQWLAWCQESGATEVEACALPAMTRMLGRLGFQHTYNFVRLQLAEAAR